MASYFLDPKVTEEEHRKKLKENYDRRKTNFEAAKATAAAVRRQIEQNKELA